ncbi:helix-turn-helix domain-containing protein [Streptomyces sp. NPDC005438]|uniref:helix-turn-helix domain-containing protein n=1 Tax=Streptomyces sp. NPDC005438 TaxID=3156880 RepID=UPI0033B65E35
MTLSRAPAPALRPWIASLWYVADPRASGWEVKLPTTGHQVLVNLERDRLSARPLGTRTRALTSTGAAVATTTEGATLLDRGEQRRLAGAVLRPGAVPAVLGVPADALTPAVVALPELLGDRAGELLERCAEESNPHRVLDLLERSLSREIDPASTPTPLLGPAMRALSAGEPVARVARALGVSASTLHRRFVREVGVPPKRYQRLDRLHRATALLRRPPGGGLAELAQLLGYHDQAHFCHDFEDLAGLSPSAYRTHLGPDPHHVRLAKDASFLQDGPPGSDAP